MTTIDELRELFDRHERRACTLDGMRREEVPPVVRHIAGVGGRSMVLHSRLTADNADAVIQREQAHFTALGHTLEWKLFSHDAPTDLMARLQARGFAIGEREATLVLDAENLPARLRDPAPHEIRRITDPAMVAPLMDAVQGRVFSHESQDWVSQMLAHNLRHHGDNLSIYAAYVDDRPVSAARVNFSAASPCGSLWGGATLPEYRGRGIYSALVAVRVREALSRGVRYLYVDTSPMSRPILEKLGFRHIADTYPCVYPPAS